MFAFFSSWESEINCIIWTVTCLVCFYIIPLWFSFKIRTIAPYVFDLLHHHNLVCVCFRWKGTSCHLGVKLSASETVCAVWLSMHYKGHSFSLFGGKSLNTEHLLLPKNFTLLLHVLHFMYASNCNIFAKIIFFELMVHKIQVYQMGLVKYINIYIQYTYIMLGKF